MSAGKSPPGMEQDPRLSNGSPANQTNATSVGLRITDPRDSESSDGFEQGYWLGYGNGYGIGYAHGTRDESDAWTVIVTGWADTFRRPDYAEIQARRIPDWRPCPRRCEACSRCIASLAYWARGGRPYLGVEAELARAS